MKKLMLLLLMVAISAAQHTLAQTTATCRADFIHFVNGTSVKFLPASNTDSVQIKHTWLFGDGSAADTTYSPLHVYAAPGTYQVIHTVRRINNGLLLCAKSDTVLVQTALSCNFIVRYTYRRDSLMPNKIQFNNATVGADTLRSRWTFGDGNSSEALNPVHTFTSPGLYRVCLVMGRDSFCRGEYCEFIRIGDSNNCNVQANFTVTRDSSAPNRIRIINNSVNRLPGDSCFWTFGDGTPRVLNNDSSFTYTYSAPGTYNVCLTIKRAIAGAVPCVRELCKPVTVINITNCNVQANFTLARDSSAPNRIRIINNSVNRLPGDSCFWLFGNGTARVLNNDSSFTYTYSAPGTYNVCLIIKRAIAGSVPCVRELCKPVTVINITNCNVQANFIVTRDSSAPNRIRIINNSINRLPGDSCFWLFGNGTARVLNNDSSFTYTYSAPGTYNVCLIIKRAIAGSVPCVRELCKPVTVINITNCNVQANFIVARDSSAPNRIRIVNNSVNRLPGDSCFWLFGNGTPRLLNNDSSFTYTYSAPGTYNVCLTIKRTIAGVPCVRELCKPITVGNTVVCNIQPLFSWRRDSFNQRLIHFKYISITTAATDTVRWNFGDSSTAIGYNTSHLYARADTFNVCMWVSRGNGCRADTCMPVIVRDSSIDSCLLTPRFTIANGSNPNRKLFTNTSTGTNSTASAMWSFGDGTSANTWNAEHTYLTPGVNVVCLTVRNSNTCTRVKCDTVRIAAPPPNCDTMRVGMQYRRDSYMPNKVYFFASSNVPVASYRWTITKANNSATPVVFNVAQPIYVFPDTGLYRYCLRVVASNGCVKERCDSIRIWSTSPPPQCVLQAFPNPASNQVAVNAELTTAGIITGTIYNNQGMPLQQITKNGMVGNNLLVFNISTLPQGFYTIRLMYAGKICYSRFQKI